MNKNHKTTVTKASEIARVWHIVDAKGQNLGRMSTGIAEKLIGKNKPYYTPAMDCGDYVVVINAQDVAVTGQKETDKMYRRHSGYPGGFKELRLEEVREKDAREIISHSVKGMIPKNKLRAPRMKRLKVFVGSNHPYENQLKETK